MVDLPRLIASLAPAELQRLGALVAERLSHVQLGPALTPRQHEVAELVSCGCTNPEIGRMLAISPNAVKKHVSRLLEVTGASNRTELATLLANQPKPQVRQAA